LTDQPVPPPPSSPVGPAANGNGHDPLNIADELRDSYLNYAMSVIYSRALPDVRDGLKPSQRRILVAMHDLNLGPTASTSKCAGIVGETMKRYHPHGEATIYPTLVRMAQDWNMRHRLVHPQGNFGSQAGLPPAAMRYTEARLSPIAGEMLADLESDTVDFIDNYDGKYREPIVLPSKFPNLLVNGSDGIAVGMATDIPPHNLREVCDALIKIIDEPEVSPLELLQIIPGPDFPTGGIICGRQGVLDAYVGNAQGEVGRGKITLRGRAEIVGEGDKAQIIVREIPYQLNRNRICEAVAQLVRDEKIKGIRDIRDESSTRSGDPVKLVISLKRDADPNLVLNQLYQYSPLEKTTSIILLALVNGQPRYLTLKQMLEEFIRHRLQVIRRRTEFLLREAKRRSHVLEGQLIAISSIEEVIHICRHSPSRDEAKVRLKQLAVASAVLERALGAEHFAALARELGARDVWYMTEAQAEAVVRMQLGQLAQLQRDEILKEYQDLRQKIRAHEELLSSDRNILNVIKADLQDIRTRYGEDRRTEITGEMGRIGLEDLIAEEDTAVTLSHNGYIKRLPLSTYRTQHRGGRGVSGGQTREDDFIEHLFVASTHAYLLCFTNRGQLYWLRVFEIPEGSRTASGRAIANVLQLKAEEKITSVIPVRDLEAARTSTESVYLMMATRRGQVKKTSLAEYARPRTGGLIGINLDDGDTLIGVAVTHPGDEVMLCTRQGMSIRFDESQARPMGRATRGVKGIALAGDDEVVGMVVTDPQGFLLTVCANGYGKRTPFGANVAGEPSEEATEEGPEEPAPEGAEAGEGETSRESSGMSYRKQKRGGKGIRDIRTSERNGPVVGVLAVRAGDGIVLVTTGGMVNRTNVDEVRVIGRNTQGVRVMNLKEGDRVVAVARIPSEEAEPVPAEE
jgi:DNA gyrase subunit A